MDLGRKHVATKNKGKILSRPIRFLKFMYRFNVHYFDNKPYFLNQISASHTSRMYKIHPKSRKCMLEQPFTHRKENLKSNSDISGKNKNVMNV